MAREPGHPIRERDVLHLHKLLTAGTLPATEVGAYKTTTESGGGWPRPPPLPAPRAWPDAHVDEGLAGMGWLAAKAALCISSWSALSSTTGGFHSPVFRRERPRGSRLGHACPLMPAASTRHHILAVDEIFAEDRPRYLRQDPAGPGSGTMISACGSRSWPRP